MEKMGLKHTLIVAVTLCHYLVSIEAATAKKVGDCAWESDGITLDFKDFTGKYLTVTDNLGFEYRYYPCKTETWKLDCTQASNAAICQDNPPTTMVIVGKLNSADVTAVVNEKAKTATFTVTYGGGTPVFGGLPRNEIVTVTCFQSKDALTFDHETASTGQYYFKFDVQKACTRATPGAASGGEAANGAALFITLIVVVIVAVSVYLVTGILLMAFWKKERGLKLIPNFEFWKDFPFLLKDGFLFTFSCFQPLREKIGPDKGTYESLK